VAAGIQELLAALTEAAGCSYQIVGEVIAGLTSVEVKKACGPANVPFIDLQVTGFSAKLERVILVDLGKIFGAVKRVVGLSGRQRRIANAHINQVNVRDHIKAGRAGVDDPQRSFAGDKSQLVQFPIAAVGFVGRG
jgi:hypothetical protein